MLCYKKIFTIVRTISNETGRYRNSGIIINLFFIILHHRNRIPVCPFRQTSCRRTNQHGSFFIAACCQFESFLPNSTEGGEIWEKFWFLLPLAAAWLHPALWWIASWNMKKTASGQSDLFTGLFIKISVRKVDDSCRSIYSWSVLL